MTQKHIIKKQILDFTLDSPIGSFTFQSEAGALYKNEIVPLLEEYCNAIDNEQEVIRIDRLEMDLGRIDKRSFSREFTRKVAQILPQKLEEAVEQSKNRQFSGDGERRNNVVEESDRDFAVLEFFIAEGCLPWWVGNDAAYEMPVLLQQTLARQPDKVKRLVAGIIGNAALVKRLVYHAADEILAQIGALFQPRQEQAIGRFARALQEGLAACPLLKSLGPAKLRPEVWRGLLWQAVSGEGQELNRQYAVEITVKQLAKLSGAAETVLMQELVDTGGEEITALPLAAERSVLPIPAKRARFKECGKLLESIAQRVKTIPLAWLDEGMYPSFIDALRQLETVAALLNQLPPNPAGKEAAAHLAQGLQTVRDLVRLFDSLPARGQQTGGSRVNPEPEIQKHRRELGDALRQLQDELVELAESTSEMVPGDALPGSAGSMAASVGGPDPFSASKEIYVSNAGLVLLWPYLSRFFETLGLVSARRFVNDSAAERAVLLLHYLAGGTVQVQEYALTLNKILCGLEAAAPVKPHLELTEAESAECDNLLQAVIGNWPALKNLSVSGVRSLFLQREGLIFPRDGQWILRVAGTAGDILLDRLPWGIGTVKLPWMERLLLVEWGVAND